MLFLLKAASKQEISCCIMMAFGLWCCVWVMNEFQHFREWISTFPRILFSPSARWLDKFSVHTEVIWRRKWASCIRRFARIVANQKHGEGRRNRWIPAKLSMVLMKFPFYLPSNFRINTNLIQSLCRWTQHDLLQPQNRSRTVHSISQKTVI